MGVGDWFSSFCKNIRMDKADLDTISNRYHRITKRINAYYYDSDSDTLHSLYVGSYGRATEIHTSDIDMLVELPYDTYKKFNAYSDNGQSQLLQEVKNVLAETYSTSTLKGDGQIVSIPFYDDIDFEILPAFHNFHDENGRSYIFANSNDGGDWKITDPKAEIDAINRMNKDCNNNLKRLCRMARAWRDENDVPISGILIDILAYNFLSNWSNRDKSYTYYDWMSRDFFKYLSQCNEEQSSWKAMGSGRRIPRSGFFESKASAAYDLSVEAISMEKHPYVAKCKWREIYGGKFPA